MGYSRADPELCAFTRTFRGPTLLPGEPGFTEFVTLFTRSVKACPELVIQPLGSIDVQKAVTFAKKQGKTMTVKGGGHMFSGVSVRGEIVLDMCKMRDIQIDQSKCQAWVGGGAVAEDIDKDASACGLAPVNGQYYSTGIAGFCLGGGSGFLSPKYGLGCDNVLAAEIVTSDGDCKIISEASNPEVLWALRGAGWGLGVITRFLLKLHPIKSYDGNHGYGGLMMWPQEEIKKVAERYFEMVKTKSIPREVLPLIAVANVPVPVFEGKPAIVFQMVWVGKPSEGEEWATKNLIGPNGIPPPSVNTCAPQDWVAIQHIHDSLFFKDQLYYVSNRYLNTDVIQDSEKAISLVVEATEKKPDNCFFVFWTMEGPQSRVHPDDTAYTHRDFSVNALWGGVAPENGGSEAIAQYDGTVEFIHGFIKAKTPDYYSTYMYSNLDTESDKARKEEHYQQKHNSSSFKPSTVEDVTDLMYPMYSAPTKNPEGHRPNRDILARQGTRVISNSTNVLHKNKGYTLNGFGFASSSTRVE